MSQNKKLEDEIINYIESSIRKGLNKVEFIKELREKIEMHLKENIS